MASKETTLAKATIWGTIWNYGGYISGRLVAFVTMLILARLLTKDDFGVAAYAGVATGFIDVIAGLGISNAVIFHKDKEGIADTAFWLNLISEMVIFTITWFGAPLAGVFFNDARATSVLQVLAFTYPIAAVGYIHGAVLQKQLAFGRRFIPSLVGAFSKALISIPMAYMGYGYWSIVAGQLGSQVCQTVTYWIVLRWRPRLRFDTSFVKPLLTYGLGLILLDFLSSIVNQTDYMLIGRNMGAVALGVYSMAFRIPEIVIQMFCSAVASVLFPIFASVQDDLEMLRRGFLKTTQYLTLIILPIGLGLALVARPVILVFLSDKWLEAIPVIRAISIFSIIQAVPYVAGVVYKAVGRLRILSYLAIAQFCLVFPILYYVTVNLKSIEGVAWAQAGIAVVMTCLSLGIASRIIKATLADIVKALIPSFAASLALAIVVVAVLYLTQEAPALIQLIAAIAGGALAYLGSIFVVQRDIFMQALGMVKNSFARG